MKKRNVPRPGFSFVRQPGSWKQLHICRNGFRRPDYNGRAVTMQEFRAYLLGPEGRIAHRVELACDDDAAARKQAQLVDGHDVELWQGSRKIDLRAHVLNPPEYQQKWPQPRNEGQGRLDWLTRRHWGLIAGSTHGKNVEKQTLPRNGLGIESAQTFTARVGSSSYAARISRIGRSADRCRDASEAQNECYRASLFAGTVRAHTSYPAYKGVSHER